MFDVHVLRIHVTSISFLRHALLFFTEGYPRTAVLPVFGAALLLALLTPARLAHCAKIVWWQHPQREQVEIVFPLAAPAPDVRRVDPLTVRILAAREAWGPVQELTLPAFTGANLLKALVPEGPGMLVQLRTKAFGFVTQYDAASRRLTIDFFPDPLGGRWTLPLLDPPLVPERTVKPRVIQPSGSAAPAAQAQEAPTPSLPGDEGERVAESVRSPALISGQTPAPERTEPDLPRPESLPPAEPMPAAGQVRGPIRAPVVQRVPATPAPGVLRSRIERVGPEDARPVHTAPDMPAPAAVVEAPDVSGVEPAPPEDKPETVAQIDVPETSPQEAIPPQREISPADVQGFVAEPEVSGPIQEEPAQNEADKPVAESEETPPAAAPAEKEPKKSEPGEEYRKQLSSARAAMMNGEFDVAVQSLRMLSSQADLPDDLRPEVLYDLADALFSLHLDDLAGNFAAVAGGYEQAMNLNHKSPRAASALRNLGVVHLRVNNLPEARAYFNVLRQEHPHDPLVPTADYYLGDYFLKRGDYAQAADHFQTVVEKYPEHSIVQQSSVGLARALYAMGFDDRAFQIMDFLEKRWPRYYIDDPSLLELAGIIALRANSLETAEQRLLTYYNLVPDTPDAHMLLARLGDIYLLTGKPGAARHVLEKTVREYPDEEGGLIAKMRLAEGGIHDDPSLDDVFYTMKAAEVYTHIIEKHPQSPLAAVATVKLAIWQIWNKRLEDSLATVRDFLANRGQHPLAPKPLEIGMEAFSQLVERNLQDARFAETIQQWELNEFLHPLEPVFSVQTQLGLAMAFWKTGDHQRAIQLARPYLSGTTPGQAQGFALDLVLGIYLEQQQWDRIVDLDPLRKKLALSPDRLRELSYALALALESLDRSDEARTHWLHLAEDLRLGQVQRGYALYFLARKAMQGEDLEKTYLYAQEALSLLLLDRKDSGKIKDCISWLTQVTERTGRMQEALAWALEFDQLIGEDDPDWAMSRYRLAQLHQRMQDHDQWQKILQDLQQKDPRGLYGRLAGSALQGRTLEDNVGRFRQ